jgi:hypothetical protein
VPDHREQIVKRVVHALEETRDPETLVWSYFDEDRDVVIDAARQTLDATREDSSSERVAAVVDRELIEALRFPTNAPGGPLAVLYVHRGAVTLGTVITALASALAFLLI